MTPSSSSSTMDDAARRRELSRKLRSPVLKRPMNCRKQVDSPGSCSSVWMCEDGTVFKSPLAFYLDGCDEQTAKEYQATEEESTMLIEREKRIYSHLGTHPAILPCLEILDCGLRFPFMKNGNLRTFLRNDVAKPPHVKSQWVKTALIAIDYIHSRDVCQGDVSARNFLVTDELDLVLCDFAGSKIGDEESLVRPETRYEKQDEDVISISRATDIFAIGSLIYEISTEKPPYAERDDDEVEQLFKRGAFPSTVDVYLGDIIRGCWTGEYASAKHVLDATLACEGEGSATAPNDVSGLVYRATRYAMSICKVWIDWWQKA